MNKKYFSLAILYDERKNIVVSMLAQSFMLLMPILMFIIGIKDLRNNGGRDGSTVLKHGIPYFMIIVICIVTVFYSYNNKESKYSFLFTQPISRDSIILSRIFAHIASYTVPIIIYGFISSILIYTNKSLFSRSASYLISNLIFRLLVLFIVLTMIVMVIHLLQMLFGKSIAAGVFSILIAMIGSLEFLAIQQVVSSKIPFLKTIMKHIIDFSYDILSYIMGGFQSTSFYSWYTVVFILSSLLIFYICVLLNRRIQAENISGLFMFSFVEKIVRFIFSMLIVAFFTVFLSLFIAFICYIFNGSATMFNFEDSDNTAQIVLLILDIVWSTLTIIVYRLIGRIVNRRRLT